MSAVSKYRATGTRLSVVDGYFGVPASHDPLLAQLAQSNEKTRPLPLTLAQLQEPLQVYPYYNDYLDRLP